MITERQIRKLMDEHVSTMNDSFEIDRVTAKVDFLAGVVAVLKLQGKNDCRFMHQIKYEESK